MKKTLFVAAFLLLVSQVSMAQEHKYDKELWAAIDARPTPEWFADAKFGIFIFWGPYSVPAWSPAGTYSEWYQYWYQTHSVFGNNNPDPEAIPEFQKKAFGDESNFYDFGPMFKAELYDPEEWADLFKRAGAKYSVLSSKHHDGFTLWPNEHAQDAREFEWNAGSVGPKRDLVGPYIEALHKVGLKAGIYYSLYEWYHPWYTSGSDKFVTDHYFPQFKDLASKYPIDLMYGDGEWDHDDSYWRSGELITWLYNESPIKDRVLINDRWFKGCRYNHGSYYTTEYDVNEQMDTSNKPWEECRGIGTSFGYNRAENIEDYATSKELILTLSDIVSRGGNLLLSASPAADGKIPPIMQERLLQMGHWLDLYGEAIYGTRRWVRSCQWSEGSRNIDLRGDKAYITSDYILRLTLNPQPGEAKKEVFFTTKDKAVYVIFPNWPGKSFTLKDMPFSNVKATLMGADKSLKAEKRGKDIVLTFPPYDITWELPAEAYVVKLQSK